MMMLMITVAIIITIRTDIILHVPPPVCVLDVFKILYFIIIMIIYTARFDLFSLSNAHEMNIIYTYTYA